MTLSLTKRPAKIGPSINTRTEHHGEEDVPGLDIPIGGLFVNAEELQALTGALGAHDAFFVRDSSSGHVPRFSSIDSYALSHKFDGAQVRINGYDVPAVAFSKAKIKGIRLKPQIGGLTLVSFTLQVNPEKGAVDVPMLLNQTIQIAIKGADLETDPDNEPELPLDHSQDGAPIEPSDVERESDEEPELSNTGRKIAAHHLKKKRAARKK